MFGIGRKKDDDSQGSAAGGGWQELVDKFMLQPHPKGGFYRETYRSHLQLSGLSGYGGPRPCSTAILYLLPEGAQTALARLKTDEIVHFYRGGPMTFVKIMPSGLVVEATLGPDIAAGHQVQHVIEAGAWFGGFCNPGSSYSFIGCTVAPGFDFEDNEFADRQKLMKEFPQAQALIERFAPPPSRPL